MLKMQMEQAQQAQAMAMMPAPEDEQFPPGPGGNAYGAPMNSTRPEDMRRRNGPYAAQESEWTTAGRGGQPITTRSRLVEHFDDLPEPVRRRAQGREREATDTYEDGGHLGRDGRAR